MVLKSFLAAAAWNGAWFSISQLYAPKMKNNAYQRCI